MKPITCGAVLCAGEASRGLSSATTEGSLMGWGALSGRCVVGGRTPVEWVIGSFGAASRLFLPAHGCSFFLSRASALLVHFLVGLFLVLFFLVAFFPALLFHWLFFFWLCFFTGSAFFIGSAFFRLFFFAGSVFLIGPPFCGSFFFSVFFRLSSSLAPLLRATFLLEEKAVFVCPVGCLLPFVFLVVGSASGVTLS